MGGIHPGDSGHLGSFSNGGPDMIADMVEDIVIAVHAAQATANMFGEPAVVMHDLNVKRESELGKGEVYLEKVRPHEQR